MTTPSAELPRYLQLMWGVDDGPRRGPKPKLTVADIGTTACAIADTEGLEAVSMKAIGDRLGVTPMSLYRYVESKEDIYGLMFDEAHGSPPRDIFSEADDWRARLTTWTTAIVDRMVEHPWVTALPMIRPPAGPRTLAWTDVGLAAFDGTDLPDGERMSTLLLLSGFTRNHVRMSAEMGAFDPTRSSGADQYARVLTDMITPDGYPHLSRAVTSEKFDDDSDDFFTEELTFGLNLILDGIAARLTLLR